MKNFNMRPAAARLMALIVLLSAVFIPSAAKPASAGVLPLQLWSNKVLPTVNPNTGGASVVGWSLPATSAPGIDVLAADALFNQSVPAGHVQYGTIRAAANSCHTVASVAWVDQGQPVRGIGIWDNCIYNGWVWFRLYNEMTQGAEQFIGNGRFRTQTLKSGTTWNTYFWHQGFQAWIFVAATTGSGPHATGEAAFRYTQHAGSGGCGAIGRTRVDGISLNTSSGWINAGNARAQIPASGCFAGGGWSFTEKTTAVNFIRANTP
jgi:hypothetical protein